MTVLGNVLQLLEKDFKSTPLSTRPLYSQRTLHTITNLCLKGTTLWQQTKGEEQKVSNITASNLSNLGCFEANYFLFSRRKRHNLLISERTPQHRRPVAATHCRAGQTRADKKLQRWLRREGTGQLSGRRGEGGDVFAGHD